jgi:hypothetical protein
MDLGATTNTPAGPSNVEGPATLMSRLMRAELTRWNRGGPIRQFLNKPVVLIGLFIFCLSLLTWAFWPLGPEGMLKRGSALMASSDPTDWDRAWDRYLEPLQRKHPDYKPEEVAAFQKKFDEAREEQKAARLARKARLPGDPEWFFQKGLRMRRQGDAAGAQRVWRAMVLAYQGDPAARPWVLRAEQELERHGNAADKDAAYTALVAAVDRVKQLRADGKEKEAHTMLQGLQELYRGDENAQDILRRANR